MRCCSLSLASWLPKQLLQLPLLPLMPPCLPPMTRGILLAAIHGHNRVVTAHQILRGPTSHQGDGDTAQEADECGLHQKRRQHSGTTSYLRQRLHLRTLRHPRPHKHLRQPQFQRHSSLTAQTQTLGLTAQRRLQQTLPRPLRQHEPATQLRKCSPTLLCSARRLRHSDRSWPGALLRPQEHRASKLTAKCTYLSYRKCQCFHALFPLRPLLGRRQRGEHCGRKVRHL